ncbi:MAG: AI-2E family transporter [bacterium]
MNIITDWFKRTFSDRQLMVLLILLVVLFAVVLSIGDILTPVLASLVIAYLLEGLVQKVEKLHVPRILAVTLVVILFLVFLAMVMLWMMPLLSKQVSDLVQQLPYMISKGQQVLMTLPEKYPDMVSMEQTDQLIGSIGRELAGYGQRALTLSLSSVIGVITVLVYLVLLPVLVFFFLKDKTMLVNWFSRWLPADRSIAVQVWREVDRQTSNYVRGKFLEIMIVFSVSYFTFSMFGLQYALLLSVAIGLSVIIPYIGATVVTIPVVLVAWFQWGWSADLAWVTVAYLVIQALDGMVLVPLLFSEVVSLHPVAIIVAILVFGGIWGFWGVFFAIPLATLVNAVLQAWPKTTPAEI